MILTIQQWWERLKLWTQASIVGAKREVVESYFETIDFRNLVQEFDDFYIANGRFPQVLRNKDVNNGNPSDRSDQEFFVPNFPGWIDYEVHEWQGPLGNGWKLFVWVKEGPNTWVYTGTRYLHNPYWVDPSWTLEEILFPPPPGS